MYQLLVYKFEPLSDVEKAERSNRNYGRNTAYDPMFPNGFNSENLKSVKALEVQLTDEEFAAVKRAVTQVM
jgi:hypothetical protein